MISKQRLKSRPVCKVTFTLPQDVQPESSASVVGTFNNWDPNANPLRRLKTKDEWKTTIELEPDQRYEFRYYVDGGRWINDDDADEYVPNEHGSENSVVKT